MTLGCCLGLWFTNDFVQRSLSRAFQAVTILVAVASCKNFSGKSFTHGYQTSDLYLVVVQKAVTFFVTYCLRS